MDKFTYLQRELDLELLEIESSQVIRLEKISDKIKRCEYYVDKFEKLRASQHPISIKDEIFINKSIKPKLTSELHYQLSMFNYIKYRPKGSKSQKKEYIKGITIKHSKFLQEHAEFRAYMKMNATHLDQIYFKEISYDPKKHANLEYHTYSRFSYPAELTITNIQCAERMIEFLNTELINLTNPNLGPSWENLKHLNWDKTKTDLVELIYSLYASGSITCDIKDAIPLFEKLFNVHIGNFYRIYADIKLKKNQTSFLDELKGTFLEKIKNDMN